MTDNYRWGLTAETPIFQSWSAVSQKTGHEKWKIDEKENNNNKTCIYSPLVLHLLQAQQVFALLYAKVAGRPGTGSYPAPSPSPTTQTMLLSITLTYQTLKKHEIFRCLVYLVQSRDGRTLNWISEKWLAQNFIEKRRQNSIEKKILQSALHNEHLTIYEYRFWNH